MPSSEIPDKRAPSWRRGRRFDGLLGALGASVIAVTLFGVRAWARMTRTPYYKD